MRRLLVVAIIIFGLLPVKLAHAQQVGQFCDDFSSSFPSGWDYFGEVVGSGLYPNTLTSDFRSRVQVLRYVPGEVLPLREVWMQITGWFNDPDNKTANTNPYEVTVSLFKNGNEQVYEGTFTYTAGPFETITPHILVPRTDGDRLFIQVDQATNHPGAPGDTFSFRVSRLCGESSFPTPTFTPSPTKTPFVVSSTPYPTVTPRPTATRTPTRTPVPSWTPIPTWTLPASRTPAPTSTLPPTSTPGGATDTPIPTRTTEPTDTPIPPQPTQEPQMSTLAAYAMNTPEPPSTDCMDWTDPCKLWPDLNLPDPGIVSPTAVAMLPTLTALPSLTPAQFGTGTPVTISELFQLSTAVDQLTQIQRDVSLTDGNGQTVSVAQRVYESGTQMGAFFAVVRGIMDSDLGPAGGLLLILFAMLILNIQVRILLFVVPIIIKIIQFILNLIGNILKLIPFIMLLAALLIWARPVRAQAPTSTPPPTWTSTPTLHAPEATPTSKYQGLRPTPSPLPALPTLNIRGQFNSNELGGQIADQAINSYRFFNSGGLLDMVGFSILLIFCLVLAANAYKRLTRDVH